MSNNIDAAIMMEAQFPKIEHIIEMQEEVYRTAVDRGDVSDADLSALRLNIESMRGVLAKQKETAKQIRESCESPTK